MTQARAYNVVEDADEFGIGLDSEIDEFDELLTAKCFLREQGLPSRRPLDQAVLVPLRGNMKRFIEAMADLLIADLKRGRGA
jgi:hypothetical protein